MNSPDSLTRDDRTSPEDISFPVDGEGLPAGEEFIAEFTRSQRRLFLFILAQVGRPTDAEEILQETNLVIWRKCRQFEPGSSFFAWSTRIAALEVLKYRERVRRDKLCFSVQTLDALAASAAERADDADLRRQALETCLGKLSDRDRELIESRYAPGSSGKSVASRLGRPENSVYQSLGRIRRTLMECIRRRLATEVGQ